MVLAVWLLCAAFVNLSNQAQGTQQPPPERALAEQTAFQNAINGIANSVVRIEPSGLSVATLQGSREATPNAGPSSGLVVDPMAGFSPLNLPFPLISKKLSLRCHQRTKQRTTQRNHLNDLLDA